MTTSTETTVVATEATTTKKAAAKKPAKKAAAKKPVAPKAKKAAAKVTKSGVAQKVFNKLYQHVLAGKKTRKDVIAKLVSDANMSEKYAATAYQSMKKAADAIPAV